MKESETPGVVHVEGNNGGDYLKVIDMGDGDVYLEVGHQCVVMQRGIFPVAVLTAALAKIDLPGELPWDDDLNEKLLSRVRKIGAWEHVEPPKKQVKRPKVHNRVTKAQLSLKEGDSVEVTLDDGSKTTDSVRGEPCKVGGTWVAWLASHGCYALCRCKPLKVKPAGKKDSGKPLYQQIANNPSSWEPADK